MRSLEEAVEKIKGIECPTGDIENRVAEILEGYEVADRNQIIVSRDKKFDRNGAEAYSARFPSVRGHIVVLAKSGMDDYVAEVVDAYIS